MCLHISVFCVHHVMCIYLSIPPLPTGTLQRVNPSLPACFATARQLFITSSWLASELCPTVSDCYTGKPKYSLLTPTQTDKKQMEARRRRRRRRGRQRIYFSLFLSWTCVAVAVDHPVWTGEGGQIRCYQTESRHCEHCDHERRPDFYTLSPPSEQVIIGIIFSIMSCWTTALFALRHYALCG